MTQALLYHLVDTTAHHVWHQPYSQVICRWLAYGSPQSMQTLCQCWSKWKWRPVGNKTEPSRNLRKFMLLTRVWGLLWEQTMALNFPRRSHLEAKWSTFRKIGRYGAENSPAKAARHFSQLLGGKLPWCLHRFGYVIFLLRDQLAKFNLQI